MKYLSLITMVCLSAILFSGCEKEKTAVINMTSAIDIKSVIPESHATVQGRTIKFGESKKDTFGPSFDFDKLQ